MNSINCKGKLIDLSTPKIMGILNLTPDSFYDGGRYMSEEAVVSQTKKMLDEGASFIDVGAYSSRPGAKEITICEELDRIIPIIEILIEEFPAIIISVDTFRSEVAEKTISKGATLINDISAGNLDKNMFKSVAQMQVPYVMMHMQGNPKTMQENPTYNNVTQDLLYYFSKKINELRLLGINDLIVDVGFGFGKTVAHNYQLLRELTLFKNLEVPILAGLSRKSMLYKPLLKTPSEALNATTSANTIALLNGASILRVHDVKEAVEAVKIVELLNA